MYQKIRNLRKDRNLTQQELAAALHCTQVCYSNYETGKRDIPTAVLEHLADYYDVSLDYLMGRTKVKDKYPRK